jgi:hypothetical protein
MVSQQNSLGEGEADSLLYLAGGCIGGDLEDFIVILKNRSEYTTGVERAVRPEG